MIETESSLPGLSTKKITFYVTKSTSPIILGMPLIRQYGHLKLQGINLLDNDKVSQNDISNATPLGVVLAVNAVGSIEKDVTSLRREATMKSKSDEVSDNHESHVMPSGSSSAALSSEPPWIPRNLSDLQKEEIKEIVQHY
eukprot:GHVP01048413.1.p1 GENE.GHVP01048413.1~~GHVP01048413.1.p1  ORF type:complete len:141 (+),score=20.76 GHVP01048413.1:837-1259(+)